MFASPYQARPETSYTIEQRMNIASGPDVLLLEADEDTVSASPILTLLQAYGDLGAIDMYDAQTATPTLGQLLPYDVVVTWSNYNYANSTAIGNVLADYVNSGGKVVNLNASMGTHGWQIQGRFMTENYTAMNGTSAYYNGSCLGSYNPTHPIMSGINDVCDALRIADTYLTTGSSPIAYYSDGLLLVAAKNNRTVVSINGFVGSTFQWTGQMPDLLHNAILWLVGPVLWEQKLSSINQNAYVDQSFPDLPTYNSFLADDFVVDKTWLVDMIFIPGNGWGSFSTLMNATALTWQLYADNGGIPDGNPAGGGNAPIWTLTLPPSDARVKISTGSDGFPSNTSLSLLAPLELPAGHYWLVFYPTMSFTPFGQFGRQPADTVNGYFGQFINPGGGFGYGTAWQPWTVIGPAQHDIAFRLGGEVKELWESIDPINGLGRSRPAGAAVDGKIYVLGGEISGGRANTVEEYDPRTGAWTTQAGLMPVPASNICAATMGTDIYVPGGYDVGGIYLSTLQVYHTLTDTWETITTDPLPAPRLGPGCAALNGKLYAFGGSMVAYQSTAYVYDPMAAAGSRWTQINSMTYPRAYLAGVTVNGKVYAVGGLDAGLTNSPYVEAYNPSDGMWHTVTQLNLARGGPGAYGVGKSLVVCGGGWSTYYRSCERYNTDQGYAGTWTEMDEIMITGRRTFAYANLGPVLYAAAGYNGTFLISAERLSHDLYLPLIEK